MPQMACVLNDMKAYVLTSVFVMLASVSFAQGKHYKNQINRTLTEKTHLEKQVDEKRETSVFQTPNYQQKLPNLDWVDTVKQKKNNASYKQHGGRPN